MNSLQIRLLGSVRITYNGEEYQAKITRSVIALLAYLTLFRHRTHPRDVLSEVFWGDCSDGRARNCLSTTLWRLRTILEPPGVPKGSYILTTPAGEVGINPTSDFWLDVANFESNTRKVTGKTIVSMDADDAAELENALQLYSGDLLEGIYDDWVLLERERLRSLYFKSLIQLMRYKKQVGALDESIIHAQQILCLDPIREEIHRELMRLYVENGQRSLALRHYKNCRKILQEELSIPPMRETQELYREILQSASADQGTLTSRTSFPTNPVQEAGSIEISQQFFFQILQSLEKLAKQQQRTNQLLDHLIKNH